MFSFKEFVNKKILIFGYGKTGKSVEKFFKKKNIRHSIWDDKIKNKKFDKNFYKKKYDFIVLSPGIDIYHHKKKKFFKKHKSKIITDLDIFFSLTKNYKYTIGITGTNGKSSFCNLLKLILKKNKINSKIIGNFGNPVLEGDFSEKKYYIIELSSYLLDYSKYIKLNSACILNVSPDHLERHLNLKNYKKIKLKIFKFLKEQGKGFYHKSSFPNYRSKLNIKYFNNINKNLISNIIGKKIKISKKILNANILPHRNELF
ncbi:MAG: Mur ligase family protein, partial [Pelagibacteraceae bacterium]